MLSIRDVTTSQIKPMLNPDQQNKYEEMMARHAPPQGMGQGGQGQGQGQPPAPPQQ
jgi:hypothetical protein